MSIAPPWKASRATAGSTPATCGRREPARHRSSRRTPPRRRPRGASASRSSSSVSVGEVGLPGHAQNVGPYAPCLAAPALRSASPRSISPSTPAAAPVERRIIARRAARIVGAVGIGAGLEQERGSSPMSRRWTAAISGVSPAHRWHRRPARPWRPARSTPSTKPRFAASAAGSRPCCRAALALAPLCEQEAHPGHVAPLRRR